MHHDAIEALKQKIIMENNENFRKRKDASLCINRLKKAFYIYSLQKELDIHCDITLDITHAKKKKLIQKKQQKIGNHRDYKLSQDSETKFAKKQITSTDDNDLSPLR